MQGMFPSMEAVLAVVDFLLSTVLLGALFAAMYKFCPIRASLGVTLPSVRCLPRFFLQAEVHWVRLELVVEVTYLTWTEDNLLRQVS